MKVQKIANQLRWCRYGVLAMIVFIWWGRFWQYVVANYYQSLGPSLVLWSMLGLLIFVLYAAYLLMPKLEEMLFYLDRYLVTLLFVLCYALYSYLDFYKENFVQTVLLFMAYYFFTWLSGLAVEQVVEFDNDHEQRCKFLEEIKSKQKLLE